MNLKKIITIGLCTVAIVFVSSCKTYNESMAVAKVDPIANKLPPMMINWKNSQAENHTNQWAGIIPPKKLSPLKASLFSEIKTNCMDEVTDSVAGSIQIELIDGSFSNSMGLLLMHCFTGYYATTLLGVPANKSKFKTDMRISILDLNNKPIKSYRYSLKKSSLQGLYYGKSSKVLSSILGKEIAKQFKSDLNKDASYICSQLLTKTYYPFGTEAGKHILKAIDLCQDGYYKQSLIELNEAKYSEDLSEITQGVMEQVYEVAYSARQQQLQQRAEAWAAVGAAVAVAGAATAAAVTSNKASKNSSSKVAGTTSSSSTASNTSSDDSNKLTQNRKNLLEGWIRDWEKQIEEQKDILETQVKLKASGDSKAPSLISDCERRINDYTQKIEQAKAELRGDAEPGSTNP